MTSELLVVDDSAEIREFLEAVLQSAGYPVISARDADEAFELIARRRPALVITDVVMPGPSGLDLLSRIRSELAPPLPPVIVSSGFRDTESEALRRGADVFLPKPVDAEDLIGIVDRTMLGRKAEIVAAAEAAMDHAARARRGARQAAEEAVRRALVGVPDPAERADRAARWLATYFGFGAGLIALEEDGAVRAASDCAAGHGLRRGEAVDSMLPQCADILETRSPLLLPDAAAQRSFAALSASGVSIRFLAGVPLLSSPGRLAVGVMCLLDSQPHRFGVADLAILDSLAAQISEVFFGCVPWSPQEALQAAPGLFRRRPFVRLLGHELQAARASGAAMELSVLEPEGPSSVTRCADDVLAITTAPQRFAMGEIARGLYAFFKRAPSLEDARDCTDDVFRALAPVRAAGVLSIAAAGPAVTAEEALRFATDACAEAERAGSSGVVRYSALRSSSGHLHRPLV